MPDQRTAQKRAEEARHAHEQSFAPFCFEDCWLEFGSGQKSENDGPGSGQIGDPLGAAQQAASAKKRANDELCDGADDDFRERRGDTKPDGK